MTVVTCWRGLIALFQKGHTMNTLLELFDLIGRDSVILHVLLIRVTLATCLRNIQRVNSRTCVFRSSDTVHTMTIRAGCHFGVSFCQTLTVRAGLVSAQLICGYSRIKTAHIVGITVAPRTKLRNFCALGNANVPFVGIHRCFHIAIKPYRRIAAVTVFA